ncbi:hypothetical protein Tco_0981114 [Tanacetum coccineum]
MDHFKCKLDNNEFQEQIGSMASFKVLEDTSVIIEAMVTEAQKTGYKLQSGNDAESGPIYIEEAIAEVQMTADDNVIYYRTTVYEQPEANIAGEA